MRRLYAFYQNRRVGTLTEDSEGICRFDYEESWRLDPLSFPISLSMPLSEQSFGNRVTIAFFENLLPEGHVRQQLQLAHKINSTVDFLAKFGRDCAGAISLYAEPTIKNAAGKSLRPTPVNLASIYEAIDHHLSVADLISEMAPGYLSLAGAQDKFAALFQEQRLFLPIHGQPTTHIVKVPIWRQGVRDSVFNEYFCMTLARMVGLDTPHCEILSGPQPLFIVERYDRLVSGSEVQRIHQEDLCQALGFTSAQKYESQGGPSIKMIFNLLAENISPQFKLKSLDQFLDWICFNLIIGNNDSHAKNLSILYSSPGKFRLAPLYDLLSTAIYPRLDKSFSLSIGGSTDTAKIGKRQINALEEELDLKPGKILKHLQNIAEKIAVAGPRLETIMKKNFPSTSIPRRINQLMTTRIKGFELQKAITKIKT